MGYSGAELGGTDSWTSRFRLPLIAAEPFILQTKEQRDRSQQPISLKS